MARNNNPREPLSYWGTVGATVVGSLIMGTVVTAVNLVALMAVRRRMEAIAAPTRAEPEALPDQGG